MAEEFEVRTISVTTLDGPHWHFGIGRLPQEAGLVYTGSQRDPVCDTVYQTALTPCPASPRSS